MDPRLLENENTEILLKGPESSYVQALWYLLIGIALTRYNHTCHFVDGKLTYEIKVLENAHNILLKIKG